MAKLEKMIAANALYEETKVTMAASSSVWDPSLLTPR